MAKVFAAPFLAAPLAGVSDFAFRRRLRRNGCRAAWTEMISAAALVRGHRETMRMIDPPDRDGDTAVQIFGAKPDELGRAARELGRLGWRRVDFNMGCPVRKVVRTGAGAALLADPALSEACLTALREATAGVLTVKMRLGWDAQHLDYEAFARLAERAGADGVILHGRTRAQGYGGVADWGPVGELAAALGIPVAGNGDVADAEGAVSRLAESGAAAVMIGRASLGAPWIFRDAHRLLEGLPPLAAPSPEAVAEDLLEQLADLASDKGERRAVPEMKKFVAWAARGFPGAGGIRRIVMAAKDASDLTDAVRLFAGTAQPREGGDPLEAS